MYEYLMTTNSVKKSKILQIVKSITTSLFHYFTTLLLLEKIQKTVINCDKL